MQQGFTAFKTGPAKKRPARPVETPQFVDHAAEKFAELRQAAGPEGDIGIDFHGAISPRRPSCSSRRWNPTNPCSSRSRSIARTWRSWPISPGAPICRSLPASAYSPSGVSGKFWRRERPRSCNPTCATPGNYRGSTDCRNGRAHYATLAPHNPLGPISLAAGLQIAASIPNFLCQEQVSLGEGYLKSPSRSKRATSICPRDRGWGSKSTRRRWPQRSATNWHNPETYDADDGSVVDW